MLPSVSSRPFLAVFLGVLAFAAGQPTAHGVADVLNVIGNLEAKGPVRIFTGNSDSSLSIADTSYAYAAGDRIVTGSGSAVLMVDDVGRLGFSQQTHAVINKTGNRFQLQLDNGAVAYAIHPDSQLQIDAAGVTVQPTRSPVMQVAQGGEELVTGWVGIGEDGQVHVGSSNGRVEVRHGGMMNVVESGQQATFQLDGTGELTQVVVEAIDGDGRICIEYIQDRCVAWTLTLHEDILPVATIVAAGIGISTFMNVASP